MTTLYPSASSQYSDTPLKSEQMLVQQIQQGELAAFRVFFDTYAPLVHRYIRFRVSTNEDAEDLTSEVFLKAWKALPHYEWQGVPLSAWLFRIAHNQVVDRYRKQRRVAWRQWLPWHAAHVENRYALIEERDVIQQAMATLSHEQQMVIYLAFFEEYTHQEIAEVLGKTANAIGVAKFRALKKLGQVLRDSSFDRHDPSAP